MDETKVMQSRFALMRYEISGGREGTKKNFSLYQDDMTEDEQELMHQYVNVYFLSLSLLTSLSSSRLQCVDDQCHQKMKMTMMWNFIVQKGQK